LRLDGDGLSRRIRHRKEQLSGRAGRTVLGVRTIPLARFVLRRYRSHRNKKTHLALPEYFEQWHRETLYGGARAKTRQRNNKRNRLVRLADLGKLDLAG